MGYEDDCSCLPDIQGAGSFINTSVPCIAVLGRASFGLKPNSKQKQVQVCAEDNYCSIQEHPCKMWSLQQGGSLM